VNDIPVANVACFYDAVCIETFIAKYKIHPRKSLSNSLLQRFIQLLFVCCADAHIAGEACLVFIKPHSWPHHNHIQRKSAPKKKLVAQFKAKGVDIKCRTRKHFIASTAVVTRPLLVILKTIIRIIGSYVQAMRSIELVFFAR